VVTVNLEINVTAVKGALDKIQRAVPSATNRAMSKTATFIQTVIKDRSSQGKSVNGGGFKSYSKGYARVRSKRGASTTPNLFFSGQMFGNMTFKKLNKTKAQIFFPNRTQNLKAFFNDQTRPFFSVNAKEETRAVAEFIKTFEREIRV